MDMTGLKKTWTTPLHYGVLMTGLCGLIALSGCGSVESEAKYPTGADRTATEDIYEQPPSIFGDGGLRLLGNKENGDEDGNGRIGGMAINSYLWRASLDTVSFMPLASADPFGGVIITDWYTPDEKPDTRFKINVFIFSRELRSDGVEVKLFEQARRGGEWANVTPSKDTARKLEDTILTRARRMRVADNAKK
jgi:hypothetical protein